MGGNDKQEALWIGLDMYDVDGDKIGTVEDVRYGEATGDPTWLIVETGLLGLKKIFVPAGEVRSSGGRLSVRYTKDRVKDAPKVDDDAALTEGDKGKLCRYYGLQYVRSADEPAEGCEEIPDQRPGG